MATVTEPTRNRALQEAIARLRLLIGSIQGGLTIIEGNRIVFVSSQLGQILGYSGEELKNMRELDWAAPEERERLAQTINEAQARGLPIEELEFWAVRKDGSRRYVRNRYSAGAISPGVTFRFVVTQDLTDREQARQAVMERDGVLQRFVESSQALAVADDPEAMLRAVAGPAMRSGPGVDSVAHEAVLIFVDLDEAGRPEWASVAASLGETADPVGTRFYLPGTSTYDLLMSAPEGPLLVPDTRASTSRENEGVAQMVGSIHARAFAALPLRTGERWYGIAVIAWPHVRRFRPEEEELYRMLGSVLAARVQAQRQRDDSGHRALWSQTAAEVSRAASTVLDTDELLHQAVDLVQERFGLYYAGLFLVDEELVVDGTPASWAVLRVGTGEAGQQMVQRGHRLEVGGESMIGQCVATKKPRVAMDVGEEPVRFANPLLPDTRTELALPLVSRGQALGALTIQSRKQAAFSRDDISVLQTMADQLAIAIDNANLLREARDRAEWEQRVRAITEQIHRCASTEAILESTVAELGQMLGASRSVIRLGTRASLETGLDEQPPREAHATPSGGYYRYGKEGGPTDDAWLPVMTRAVLEGDTVLEREPGTSLAIPIRLQDKLIGAVGFTREDADPWGDDEISAAEAIVDEVAESLEKQRLLDETRLRAWQLAISNEIGQAISSTLEMDVLLRQIVDTIKARFGYYFVAIMLIEGDQIIFQEGSTIGDVERRLVPRSKAMKLDAPQGMIVEAVRSGRPVLANDVLTDPRYIPIPEMPDTRSELDVPIIVAGKVIGVLDVQGDAPTSYTQDDVDLLQALANQAGVAIENARLYREAQAYAEEQTILRQISQAVGESLGLQELLETALDVVLTALGFESGLVSLSHEESGELYLAAQRGLPGPLARKMEREGLQGTLCDHVFRTGEAIAIADVREGAPVDVEGVIRAGLLTYVGVPLVHQDQRLGTFCFFSSRVHEVAERDLLMLEATGRQVGVGVANARLYEQTEAALAEAEAAHQTYLRRGWRQHLRQRELLRRSGFVYQSSGEESGDETFVEPDLWRPEMERAASEGSPATMKSRDGDHERTGVAVPIKLRGQTLGVMGVEADATERQWTEDEIALLAAVSEQLGQALESARLFADTERSAERERLIGEITAKIRASTDMRDILRTTAEELGHVLGTSRALVQLAPTRPEPGTQGRGAPQDGPAAEDRDSIDEDQGQREG